MYDRQNEIETMEVIVLKSEQGCRKLLQLRLFFIVLTFYQVFVINPAYGDNSDKVFFHNKTFGDKEPVLFKKNSNGDGLDAYECYFGLYDGKLILKNESGIQTLKNELEANKLKFEFDDDDRKTLKYTLTSDDQELKYEYEYSFGAPYPSDIPIANFHFIFTRRGFSTSCAPAFHADGHNVLRNIILIFDVPAPDIKTWKKDEIRLTKSIRFCGIMGSIDNCTGELHVNRLNEYTGHIENTVIGRNPSPRDLTFKAFSSIKDTNYFSANEINPRYDPNPAQFVEDYTESPRAGRQGGQSILRIPFRDAALDKIENEDKIGIIGVLWDYNDIKGFVDPKVLQTEYTPYLLCYTREDLDMGGEGEWTHVWDNFPPGRIVLNPKYDDDDDHDDKNFYFGAEFILDTNLGPELDRCLLEITADLQPTRLVYRAKVKLSGRSTETNGTSKTYYFSANGTRIQKVNYPLVTTQIRTTEENINAGLNDIESEDEINKYISFLTRRAELRDQCTRNPQHEKCKKFSYQLISAKTTVTGTRPNRQIGIEMSCISKNGNSLGCFDDNAQPAAGTLRHDNIFKRRCTNKRKTNCITAEKAFAADYMDIPNAEILRGVKNRYFIYYSDSNQKKLLVNTCNLDIDIQIENIEDTKWNCLDEETAKRAAARYSEIDRKAKRFLNWSRARMTLIFVAAFVVFAAGLYFAGPGWIVALESAGLYLGTLSITSVVLLPVYIVELKRCNDDYICKVEAGWNIADSLVDIAFTAGDVISVANRLSKLPTEISAGSSFHKKIMTLSAINALDSGPLLFKANSNITSEAQQEIIKIIHSIDTKNLTKSTYLKSLKSKLNDISTAVSEGRNIKDQISKLENFTKGNKSRVGRGIDMNSGKACNL